MGSMTRGVSNRLMCSWLVVGCLGIVGCPTDIQDGAGQQRNEQIVGAIVRVDINTVFHRLDRQNGRLVNVSLDDIHLLEYYRIGGGYNFEYLAVNGPWVTIRKGTDEFIIHARDVLTWPANATAVPFIGYQALVNAYQCPLYSLGSAGRLEPTGGYLYSGASEPVRIERGMSLAIRRGMEWVSAHCAQSFSPLNVDFPQETVQRGTNDILGNVAGFSGFRQMAMDQWRQNHLAWTAENQRCYCAAHMVGCADPNQVSAGGLSMSDAVPIAAAMRSGSTVAACNQACQSAKYQLWTNYNQAYQHQSLPEQGCDPQHGVEFQILPVGVVAEHEKTLLASGTILGKIQTWTDNTSLWD